MLKNHKNELWTRYVALGICRFVNLSGLFIIMGYSVKQLVCCSLPFFSISSMSFHLYIYYEFKPNALTNWVQYFSGGRPLLHFFPIPSSSRWCSILSCLIMCPIIIIFLL
uniref:Uncharacterized protein n=1 Tax=Cacopsylla melanoneura TaxID=428564 RepID=A0A8D8LCY3_9HEMI